jgi:hypothetical protein
MISGRTLDNRNTPMAFAVTNHDNHRTMSILKRELVAAGGDIDQSKYILLSDRGTAVVKFVKECFLHVFHMCCQLHLSRNLTAWVKFINLYWKAARYHCILLCVVIFGVNNIL